MWYSGSAVMLSDEKRRTGQDWARPMLGNQTDVFEEETATRMRATMDRWAEG